MSQDPAYVLLFRCASPMNMFCCMQVRALYSATLPESVEDLARSVLKDPLRIVVSVPAQSYGVLHAANSDVTSTYR